MTIQAALVASRPVRPSGAGVHRAESSASGLEEAAAPPLHDVLAVGNSVAGTVSFLDGHTFKNLGSINVIPDLKERLAEIYANPISAIAYTKIKHGQTLKHFEPAGGNRYIDDIAISPDGTRLYVSRSNLGDAAAFDLTSPSHRMLWRTHIDGHKIDHAALSPDGKVFVASATTADKVDAFDTETGKRIGSFPTGHFPHQNDYSKDGKHIYNSSIGDVSLPASRDKDKGVRQITVVDASTFKVVRTYPFEEGIRPAVITDDEKTMYAQLSYLNGLIKYDLVEGKIVQTLTEPLSNFAQATYPTPDDFPHDSEHHGLAMSGDGTRLADCGTIDNTVSIVSTGELKVLHTTDVGSIPYWATTSHDGKHAFISLSGSDAISVISYDTGEVETNVPVGKFPQRTRLARIPDSVEQLLSPSPG